MISVTLDAQGNMPGHDRNENQCFFCNIILGQDLRHYFLSLSHISTRTGGIPHSIIDSGSDQPIIKISIDIYCKTTKDMIFLKVNCIKRISLLPTDESRKRKYPILPTFPPGSVTITICLKDDLKFLLPCEM